jgi:carbamoyl-phosphate synthase large subunit
VNMFCDRTHRMRSAVPHLRYETRAGEISKGTTERQRALLEISSQVAGALPGVMGALCFQAIVRADGVAAVFEVNARFGGGYPLAWRAGARFSRWLLEWAGDLPSSIHDEWQSGLTMLRYDGAVFLDAKAS